MDLNSEWASYRWRATSRQQSSSGLDDPAGYLPRDAGYIGQHAKPEDVAAEFSAQVDIAAHAGIPITHLDSHGGIVLYTPWLFESFWKLAVESQLPAGLSKEYILARGKPTEKPNIYHFGNVEIDINAVVIDRIVQMQPGIAKEDWLSAYERTLGSLPPGTYLLRVHLGHNDEELQAMTVDHPNWGAQWRQNDYDVISNPDFHRFLKDKGFRLVGWKELRSMSRPQKSGSDAKFH